jgi:MFS transporter, CP family, cyanate transporter
VAGLARIEANLPGIPVLHHGRVPTDLRPTDPHVGTRRQQFLVVVGLVLLAVNLRPAVTSLGTLLVEVRQDLGMSASVAGVLTTVPVLCFSGFGLLAPAAARRVGIHRVVFVSIALMVVGLSWRALTDSVAVFLGASALALAGMASGNVLLPALVKRHFPHRIGLLTAIYSAALMGGAALPTLIAVPVAGATGSWRGGLAVWAVAAGVALLPWVMLLRHDVRAQPETHPRIAWSAVVRSKLAWAMAGFFGLQSSLAYSQFGWVPQIYRDAGLSVGSAALMLGILTVVGIPVPLLLPALAQRFASQVPIVTTLCLCALTGFVGLLLWPQAVPWLWALLLGVGGGAFPWVLTMIGLRAATPEGTVVLSGFVQGVGYVLAALGPLTTGLLYGATGGWTVPLAVLAVVTVPMLLLGLTFARPRFLEDELAAR